MKLTSLLGTFVFAASFLTVSAQVTVDNNVNAVDGVQNILLGPGITVSNITFAGNNAQIGSFTCTGACNMGLASGLVMGSGNIDQVPGNNSGATNLGPASGTTVTDPDLVMLAGTSTIRDVAKLEFDFIPTGDTLQFRFVFGSEEYPEFVSAGFNDAFGFFLSGPGITGPYTNNARNIALLPNGITPVTIDNVNANFNSQFYVNNNTINANQIECDGYTVVLTAFAIVQCGQQYHIKLAICDAGDALYDSMVFIEGGSFASNTLDLAFQQPGVSPTANGVYEGCPEGNVIFTRPATESGDLVYDLTYFGTATYGVDYPELPTTVVIPAGTNSVTVPFSAVNDGFGEGIETIVINVQSSVACSAGLSITLSIYELAPLVVTANPINVPCNEAAVAQLNISGGYGNYSVNWQFLGTGNPLVIPNPTNGVLNYSVSDVCEIAPVTGSVNVNLIQYQPIVVDIGPNLSLDCNDQAFFAPFATGGNGVYTYTWLVNNEEVSTGNTFTIADPVNSTVTAIATDGCGATGSNSATITLPETPIFINLPAVIQAECNSTVTLNPQVSGGVGGYTYNWTIDGESISNDLSITVDAVHNQAISLTIQDECDNLQTQITTVQIISQPITVSLGPDVSATCLQFPTVQPVVSGGTGNYIYTWTVSGQPAGGSQQIVVPAGNGQTVQLVVTDECNGLGQDEMQIIVPAVPINISLNSTMQVTCIQNFSVAANSVTGGVGAFSYSWSINGSPYSNAQSFNYTTSVPVTIQLSVSDQCGNSNSAQMQVSIAPSNLTASIAQSANNICPATAVNLTATSAGAVGSVTYTWSTQQSGGQVQVAPTQTSTYQLTATDACNHTASASATINVLTQTGPLDVADETDVCINLWTGDLMSGGYMPYTVVFNDDLLNYNPQEGTFSGSATGEYTFVVTDQCGFTETGVINVLSCETVIPNIFSPNGDGKNETFFIKGLEAFSGSSLTVWNRWGNTVYESTNYRNNWNGSDLEDGIYYYVLKRADGKNFEGYVHLVRK